MFYHVNYTELSTFIVDNWIFTGKRLMNKIIS